MRSGKDFYRNGLRFQCQGEGRCCISRGRYGYVYLSFGDRKRLAEFLKMPTADFTRRFTRKVDGSYELIYTGRDCPFLVERRCSVYDARPWQCRTWPFWPENMDTLVWEREVLAWCPGAGKGRLYTGDEIDEILLKRRDVT